VKQLVPDHRAIITGRLRPEKQGSQTGQKAEGLTPDKGQVLRMWPVWCCRWSM
jgi:hypothetical protein